MNEAWIIQRIAEGNEETIERIYSDFMKEFIAWCARKFSVTADEAQDIYQSAVIALYENCRDGKVSKLNSSLKTYLFAIGRNKALEHLQRQKRMLPLEENENHTEPADEEENSNMDEQEKINQVLRCMKELGEPCRTLLELFYFQKKSMEEISELMKYSNADTAKNVKYKCLSRLRKLCREQKVFKAEQNS